MQPVTPQPTPRSGVKAAPASHGFRITLPMVLAWLTTTAMVVPIVLSDLGTLHLPPWVAVVGICFVHIVGQLNHSPLATPGGGLPRVSSALLLCFAGLLAVTQSGCGATGIDLARGTIETVAVGVDNADTHLSASIRTDCTPATAGLAPGSVERIAAVRLCLSQRHYDTALLAIAQADRALRASQAAIDSWVRLSTPGAWLTALPCLALSTRDVLAAVAAAGVVLPPELVTGLAALDSVTSACTAPAAVPS